MKILTIIGRILLVAVIAAVFTIGIYFVLGSGNVQNTSALFSGGQGTLGIQSNGLNPGAHQGQFFKDSGQSQFFGNSRGHGEGNVLSSQAAWLDLLKNISIIGIVILCVSLVRKVMSTSASKEATD